MKESLNYKIFNVFNVFIMMLVLIVTVYPFLNIIALSFSSEQFILSGQVSILPKGFTMEAYKLVFEHPSFAKGYSNTIYYTVCAIFIQTFMTTICAYPLSKKELPGRSILIKFIMFTMFFTGGLIPNFLLIKDLGMYNTIWAITIPGAIGVWYVIIMITFFQGIPNSLEEAARIDGAGTLKILWNIILPLSKPILATMVLFYGVGQWNNWFGPLIYFNKNDMYPITLFLRNILMSAQQLVQNSSSVVDLNTQQVFPAESLKSAAIILVTAPILCLYPFAQKYFVKGLLLGSIK